MSRGHRLLLQQPHTLLQQQPHRKLGFGFALGVTGCCRSRVTGRMLQNARSWGSGLSHGDRMMLQQPHRLQQQQPHKKLGIGVAVGVTGSCCSSQIGC